MPSAQEHLGHSPEGISAIGWMEEEKIGAQETTTYTLSITNDSGNRVEKVKVEVKPNELDGVKVHPPRLTILVLEPGETANRVFLVHNTTDDVATNYTLHNRISYAEQVHDLYTFSRS